MAGAGIKIDFKLPKVLDSVLEKLKNTLPLAQQVARVVERDQRHHILSGEIKPVSVRAALQGGKTLYDTGRLAGSIKAVAISPWVILCGTNVKYAAIHQFGGVIKPRVARVLAFQAPVTATKITQGKVKMGYQWVFTKQVNMPQRPFLYLKDKEKKNIEEFLRSEFQKMGFNQ